MARGMGESVPLVERGNIPQKFTANSNPMGRSLSLCYSLWCRWALMKRDLTRVGIALRELRTLE